MLHTVARPLQLEFITELSPLGLEMTENLLGDTYLWYSFLVSALLTTLMWQGMRSVYGMNHNSPTDEPLHSPRLQGNG